jgi:hypothetical protein
MWWCVRQWWCSWRRGRGCDGGRVRRRHQLDLQCTACHAVSGHWALQWRVGGRALCELWRGTQTRASSRRCVVGGAVRGTPRNALPRGTSRERGLRGWSEGGRDGDGGATHVAADVSIRCIVSTACTTMVWSCVSCGSVETGPPPRPAQCTACHAVSGHWALTDVGGRALCAPWAATRSHTDEGTRECEQHCERRRVWRWLSSSSPPDMPCRAQQRRIARR